MFEKYDMVHSDRVQEDETDEVEEIPLTTAKTEIQHDRDITCGCWIFQHPNLQKFANKETYIVLFGILGCLFSGTYSYYVGTLSTVEKRFGIPSKVTGLITVGNDISSLLVSSTLTYYASKKHQPRWIGFGMYSIVIFCILTTLPHFIFGPGTDGIHLTQEFRSGVNYNISFQKKSDMCSSSERKCQSVNGNLWAPIILFTAQFVAGLGGALYYTLGVSYMDDNVKKSKSPMLLSLTYFVRSIGPVIGLFISSLCLKIYIAPTLTPVINNEDPRWLGAWWLGWIIFAIFIFIFATFIILFPRVLPETKNRRTQQLTEQLGSEKASLRDMLKSYKRLFSNKILMCNNLASVFYVFGSMPFFMFAPKYKEVMFAQTSAFASLLSGSVSLVCGTIGLFLSGLFLTKYKPRARSLAGWNVICGIITVLGFIAFSFLECQDLSKNGINSSTYLKATNESCNRDCNCDFVTYSPVCSINGFSNFISPCHAGCENVYNSTFYYDCKCVESELKNSLKNEKNEIFANAVKTGPCAANCNYVLIIYILVLCMKQLIEATGKVTNFLIAVRCVSEKDKPLSIGLSLTMLTVFAFLPAPIIFGYILDYSCDVWGKTCTGKSNCWLYNNDRLRYWTNYTSAGFILLGTLFDAGVWYLSKDLHVFDENEEKLKNKIENANNKLAWRSVDNGQNHLEAKN